MRHGLRFQLRLLWARTGYRPWARLLHRFNLHHTKRIGPLEDGAVIHRCDWCGASRVDRPFPKKLRDLAEPVTSLHGVKGEEGGTDE